MTFFDFSCVFWLSVVMELSSGLIHDDRSLYNPAIGSLQPAECKWDLTDRNFVALTLFDGKQRLATMKRSNGVCQVDAGNAYVNCHKDQKTLSISAIFPDLGPGQTRTYVCNITMFGVKFDHETYTTNASRTVRTKGSEFQIQGEVFCVVVVLLVLLLGPANIFVIRSKWRARTKDSKPKPTANGSMENRRFLPSPDTGDRQHETLTPGTTSGGVQNGRQGDLTESQQPITGLGNSRTRTKDSNGSKEKRPLLSIKDTGDRQPETLTPGTTNGSIQNGRQGYMTESQQPISE